MKKKIVGIAAIVVLLAGLLSGGILMLLRKNNVQETGNVLGVSWYNETDEEFTITTAQQLIEFARLSDFYTFEGQTIKLGANIVLNEGSAKDWAEKAPEQRWSPISEFAGTFDGQNHSISGVYGKGFEAQMALFTETASSAKIQNLKLLNSYFETTGSNGTASFSSSGNGTFLRLYSDAIINCKGGNCGGIVGVIDMQGTFEECWFEGTINQTGRKMGGIVATVSSGRVSMKHCLFSGELHTTQWNFSWNSTDGPRAGGLCGVVEKTAALVLDDSLAAGPVTAGHNTYCGSLLGVAFSGAQIAMNDVYDGGTASSKKSVGSANSTGYPVVLNETELVGTKAYQWTTLDFDNYWVAVENDTPALKHFAESAMDLSGIEKAYDIEWYMDGMYSFTLTNVKELYGLYLLSCSNNFENVTIELGADIVVNEGNAKTWSKKPENAPENPWYPIGTQTSQFNGVFDGKGHTISGVYVDRDQHYTGLFGFTSINSEILNLQLKNSVIRCVGNESAYGVGSIVGEARGLVDTVYSDAIIITDAYQVGGIVGRLNAMDDAYLEEPTVSKCWYDGNLMLVGTGRHAGGIVGIIGKGTALKGEKAVANIQNCLNTSTITSERKDSSDGKGGQAIGGLIGRGNSMMTTNLTDCLNAGSIQVEYYTYVGAAIGRMNSKTATWNIERVYATKESYKNTSGATIPYSNSGAVVHGGVAILPENFLTGVNGYRFTELNFKEHWSVVTGDTPILSAFSSKSVSVAGLKKMIDTSWYKSSAKRLKIDSLEDMYGLCIISTYDAFAEKTIRLGANIALNPVDVTSVAAWAAGTLIPDNQWLPIGNTTTPFAGTFDGQGHTISGLYIKDTSEEQSYTGLFGVTAVGSSIKNLKLTDSYLERSNQEKGYAFIGSIAGELRGALDTVYSNAVIKSDGLQSGGLVGRLNYMDTTYKTQPTINNCWFDGSLTGETMTQAGGIAGMLGKGSKIKDISKAIINITNCLNTGYISNGRKNSKDGLGGQYIGGILGVDNSAVNAKISGCLNAGTIDVLYPTYVGSVVGRIKNKSSVFRIADTYAVKECFKTPIGNTGGTLKGSVINVPKSVLTGYSAYEYSTLDFDKYWTVVEIDTPILQSFANAIPSITNIAKKADISWYDEAASVCVIDSVKDLYGFYLLSTSRNFKGQTIELGADIDIKQADLWYPIGSTASPFAGIFDGKGHTISGLCMKDTSSENTYSGLFAVTAVGSTLKNFKLTDSTFERTGNAKGYSYIGSIAGELRGTLEGVYSNAKVVADGIQVGGLVGRLNYSDATYKTQIQVRECWFDGSVTGATIRQAGGIAGMAGKNSAVTDESRAIINIENCLNTGLVSNERKDSKDDLGGQYIGGILGTDNAAVHININGCINAGTIDVKYETYVGSIYGRTKNATTVLSINETYAVEEAYDTPIYKGVGTQNGFVYTVQEKVLTGYHAYQFTSLDFADAWAVVENEMPVPQCLASSIPRVSEEDKMFDKNWYQDGNLEIGSLKELYSFYLASTHDDFSDTTISLTHDIYFESNEWYPIGNYNQPFAGTFEGNNHKIYDICVKDTREKNTYSGLFGVIGVESSVQNLRLEGGSIERSNNKNGYAFAGSIAGELRGSLTNVYSSANVITDGKHAGGLVGRMNYMDASYEKTLSVEKCWYAGDVTGTSVTCAGGIVGITRADSDLDNSQVKMTISNTLFTGNVGNERTGGSDGRGGQYLGGLLGTDDSKLTITISDCLIAGTVEADYKLYVGTLIGRVKTGSTFIVENTYVTEGNFDVAAIQDGGNLDEPYVVSASNAQGCNAYHTLAELNYINNWSIRAGDTPIPQNFEDTTDVLDSLGWYKGKTSPYQIDDVEELYSLMWLVNSETDTFPGEIVELTEDIHINGTVTEDAFKEWVAGTKVPTNVWYPIGAKVAFQGTFDGNEHVISGMYLNNTNAGTSANERHNIGLFGVVSGDITELRLESSYLKNSATNINMGNIVAYTSGNVSKVYTDAYAVNTVNNPYHGGIVGRFSGDTEKSISECWFDGTLIGKRYIAGIVGFVEQGGKTIQNCLNSGSITSSYNGNVYHGGIVGQAYSKTGTVLNQLHLYNCLDAGTHSYSSGSSVASVGSVIGAITKASAADLIDLTITKVYSTTAESVIPAMAVTTGADVTGAVDVIVRNSIVGYNVYSTDLKLVSEAGWKPIQGHVPVPSAFVGENKVIALDKVALYDTEWFTQQTYEIDTLNELYGLAKLSQEGQTFQGITIQLKDNIAVNTDAETKVEQWIDGDAIDTHLWIPIGQSTPFQGTFNGNGNTISGMYTKNSTAGTSTAYIGVGLFGQVSGEIQNLKLKHSYISNTKNYMKMGSIAGILTGSLTNVYSNAEVRDLSVNKSAAYTGGLTGSFEGTGNNTITGCWYDGEVEGYRYVGGITGLVTKGNKTIQNCLVTKKVVTKYSTTSNAYAGGFVGQITGTSDCDLIDCLFAGAFESSQSNGKRVGSVIGSVQSETTVTDVYTIQDGAVGYQDENELINSITVVSKANILGDKAKETTGTPGLFADDNATWITDTTTVGGGVPLLGYFNK